MAPWWTRAAAWRLRPEGGVQAAYAVLLSRSAQRRPAGVPTGAHSFRSLHTTAILCRLSPGEVRRRRLPKPKPPPPKPPKRFSGDAPPGWYNSTQARPSPLQMNRAHAYLYENIKDQEGGVVVEELEPTASRSRASAEMVDREDDSDDCEEPEVKSKEGKAGEIAFEDQSFVDDDAVLPIEDMKFVVRNRHRPSLLEWFSARERNLKGYNDYLIELDATGSGASALAVVQAMRADHIKPDLETYLLGLRSAANAGSATCCVELKELFRDMPVLNRSAPVSVDELKALELEIFADAYAYNGQKHAVLCLMRNLHRQQSSIQPLSAARSEAELERDMVDPFDLTDAGLPDGPDLTELGTNVNMWSSLIMAYGRLGEGSRQQAALEYCEQINAQKSARPYNAVFETFASKDRIGLYLCWRLYRRMKQNNIAPTSETVTSMLLASTTTSKSKIAVEVLADAFAHGIALDEGAVLLAGKALMDRPSSAAALMQTAIQFYPAGHLPVFVFITATDVNAGAALAASGDKEEFDRAREYAESFLDRYADRFTDMALEVRKCVLKVMAGQVVTSLDRFYGSTYEMDRDRKRPTKLDLEPCLQILDAMYLHRNVVTLEDVEHYFRFLLDGSRTKYSTALLLTFSRFFALKKGFEQAVAALEPIRPPRFGAFHAEAMLYLEVLRELLIDQRETALVSRLDNTIRKKRIDLHYHRRPAKTSAVLPSSARQRKEQLAAPRNEKTWWAGYKP